MKEERFIEEDFEGFLEDLIKSGRLDDKEAGIAKRMLDKGYDNLSDKQKYVFNKMIRNNSVEECQRCACVFLGLKCLKLLIMAVIVTTVSI